MSAAAALSLHAEEARWGQFLGLQSVRIQSAQAGTALRQQQVPNNVVHNIADQPHSSHSSPSSSASTSEESEMEFRSSDDGEFQGAGDRLFRSRPARETLADQMGQDDLTIAMSNALRNAFGESNSAVKRIAQVANCNSRAARNWLQGENPPSLLYALRLMAHVPEFQAEIPRLAAMESSLDPNFERAMSEAIALFQQHGRPK